MLADNGCRLFVSGHWHEFEDDSVENGMMIVNPGWENGTPRLVVKEVQP
jgi:predicted phosphodiesterase